MINIQRGVSRTNSYYPEEWELKEDGKKPDSKFLAYWAKYQEGKIFFPVSRDFDPEKPCKVIKTKKGGYLLINCPEEQDENILLLFVYGDFRGSTPDEIYTLRGTVEVLFEMGSCKHCNPLSALCLRVSKDFESYTLCHGRHLDGFVKITMKTQKFIDRKDFINLLKERGMETEIDYYKFWPQNSYHPELPTGYCTRKCKIKYLSWFMPKGPSIFESYGTEEYKEKERRCWDAIRERYKEGMG